MKSKILVCVYTCLSDDDLLDDFYKSSVVEYLQAQPNTRIIEVRADQELEKNVFDGQSITLKTKEHYQNLPRKTFMMIQQVVSSFDFDYLIKIDVTTLTRSLTEKILTGGKLISEREIMNMLSDGEFFKDYNGYVSLNVKRRGAENWAKNKNIKIEYDRVFSEDNLPPFFSGKLWVIDRNFASYITKHGAKVENQFSRFFPAEDAMVGRLYENYISRSRTFVGSTFENLIYRFRLLFSKY